MERDAELIDEKQQQQLDAVNFRVTHNRGASTTTNNPGGRRGSAAAAASQQQQQQQHEENSEEEDEEEPEEEEDNDEEEEEDEEAENENEPDTEVGLYFLERTHTLESHLARVSMCANVFLLVCVV